MTKYRVFQEKAAAENAARKLYGEAVRVRADEMQGFLDDWNNGRAKTDVKNLPAEQLGDGDRFPLYGRNAASNALEKEQGHTKAWAIPMQTQNGLWVFPSPDEQGVEYDLEWFPETTKLS